MASHSRRGPRQKIQNSKVLNRLIQHVEGELKLDKSQVSAGLGLLKKVLPDLASVEVSGDPDRPLAFEEIRRTVVDTGNSDSEGVQAPAAAEPV
jgi:hypothetical protein